MRSFVKLLSVGLILSMILVGCGGGGQPSKGLSNSKGVKSEDPAPVASETKETPAAQPAMEEITIKLGSTEKESLKHLMVNMNSFGKDQKIKLEFMEYKGGGEVTEALLSGEIDVAVAQVENVLRDTSGELRIVSLLTDAPALTLLVDSKYKDEIKSVKDLAGKKVGVSSLKGGSGQFLLALLNRHGIDSSSMTILPVGLDAVKNFKEGSVHATVSLEPFVTQVIENGVAVPLVDTRKVEGIQEVYGVDSMAWHGLVMRQEYLTKNPANVERMVAAVRQSLERIATASIEELVADTPEYMYPNKDKALFTKMLEQNRSAFTADGKVTEKLLAPVWADMQAKGAAPKDTPLPFSQYVASSK